jgi:hypothetical protein
MLQICPMSHGPEPRCCPSAQLPPVASPAPILCPALAGKGKSALSWRGMLESRFLKALEQAGGVWVSLWLIREIDGGRKGEGAHQPQDLLRVHAI